MRHNKQVAEISGLYNINKTYLDNVRSGPEFDKPLPERKMAPESQWIDFMGFKVASPLGVPAGPLLTSDWTSLAASLGFDIVTYKTIRSYAYAGQPLPNIVFVQIDPDDPRLMRHLAHPPDDVSTINITNSFGMPSMPPEFLQNDIRQAKNRLAKGQVLSVSVTGSPCEGGDMAEDFVRAAQIARDAGADIIEANFSCPNVGKKEGSLYCDPDTSYYIAAKLAAAIAPVPLMVKVGRYQNVELMRSVLTMLARANVRGVCGINTISARVLDGEGRPALGPERETSGICGAMIRPAALDFVRTAYSIISQDKLDLELAGCGGIMLPEHFDEFLAAGAKAALSATGMMWDPYLAHKWHQKENK